LQVPKFNDCFDGRVSWEGAAKSERIPPEDVHFSDIVLADVKLERRFEKDNNVPSRDRWALNFTLGNLVLLYSAPKAPKPVNELTYKY
jgi:hypothetical protein